LSLLLTALAAAAVSALLTRAMIPWLQARGAVATENDRTMHTGIIPKGGGLPLLVSVIAVTSAFHPLTALAPPILAALVALAVLSWRDDVSPLPAAVRFPVHLGAAALFVMSLPGEVTVFQGWLPLALDRVLTILALTWMMNLYNFMDGINGIAGAETVAIAGGYWLIGATAASTLSYLPLAATLVGASAGFLVWNCREKALVFLGDVGSVPLGFLTGALMIDLAIKGYLVAALILPSYFLADATITLLRRLMRGEKVWEAHKTHFYQRAAQGYGRHLPVVAWISYANLLLIYWAVEFQDGGTKWAALALAAAILVPLLILFDRVGKSRSSGKST
jgi:UDP-N-acetylmuramyl pentapeptide phosphotransferase/UDP-N-acetylglucosamine-1-phosphate transferase